MKEFYLFDTVIWRGRVCVVTNAFACGGTKITVSPKGNGDSPAKYYNVFPDDIELLKS